MLIKLNSVKLGGIVVGNRLKKFYVREINLIKDFAYSASKVPNAVNAKKLWYLVGGKNKFAKSDN